MPHGKIIPVFKKILKVFCKMLIAAFIIVILLIGIPRIITELYANSLIYSQEDAPQVPAGVVFGAGLNRDGSATAVLRHRVETAANLYFAGKISKILMSGDNRFIDYNEPAAMQAYALELGVPAEDIVLDYAGRRTYDTCYRAQEIFRLDEVILITQRFHLPRALFLCNQLGLKSYGVEADRVVYRKLSRFVWNAREIPASLMALWDIYIRKPLPVLGNQEPIFPEKFRIAFIYHSYELESKWNGLKH